MGNNKAYLKRLCKEQINNKKYIIMSKKILLVIIFLAFLTFVPTIKASAAMAQVYVGVQISGAQAPGCVPGTNTCYTGAPGAMTDSNWCLPVGTTLAIQNNGGGNLGASTGPTVEGYVSPSTNIITITKPACSGGTIWSGLYNLTVGNTYKAYITASSFCPGMLWGGECWVTYAANKSCGDTCLHYGLVPNNTTNCMNENFVDSGGSGGQNPCGVIEALKGSSCENCSLVGSSTYNYYTTSADANPNSCFYTNAWTQAANCNAIGATAVRVCACYYPGTAGYFTFPFIP